MAKENYVIRALVTSESQVDVLRVAERVAQEVQEATDGKETWVEVGHPGETQFHVSASGGVLFKRTPRKG